MKSRSISIFLFTFAVLALGLQSVSVIRAADSQKSSSSSANGDLFKSLVPVLRHPRCMNCHSTGDYPRQGDDGHRHTMGVRRGGDLPPDERP